MTTPKRTSQYRVNKLGVFRVYHGTFTLPPEAKVAYAVGEGVTVIAAHAGQEVFAVRPKSTAIAAAPNTTAYACADRSKASALGKDTTAIAMHGNSRSYARKIGAVAYATIAGAKAFEGDRSGIALVDTIQAVFPNHNSPLCMGFS